MITVGAVYYFLFEDFKTKVIKAPEIKQEKQEAEVFINTKGHNFTLPEEPRSEYLITAQAGYYPRFVKAVIEPVKVRVGDLQKMEVEIESDLRPSRVWAEIETDKDAVIVDLELTEDRTISFEDFQQQHYLVKENGENSTTTS